MDITFEHGCSCIFVSKYLCIKVQTIVIIFICFRLWCDETIFVMQIKLYFCYMFKMIEI
jgi:hypothetical protein